MAKRIKKEVEEKPIKTHCDCNPPDLIPERYEGKYGTFSFCKRCNLERRLDVKHYWLRCLV